MDIAKFKELYAALDFCIGGMEKIKKVMDSGDEYAAARLLVKHFKTRTRPYYFYDALQKEKQLEIVQKDSLYIAKIVGEADRVMGHKPEMFGVPVDFDDLAIWDFAQYGASSTYGGLMNRFEWLIPIGQAYWLTDDEKYAEFFLKLVRSWITANPLTIRQALVRGQGEDGFPWNNSLDIGFRLKNLVALFAYFRTYSGWNDTEYIDFLYLILQHGRILYPQQGNLFGSNWQTQECEGLAHAGVMFPEFKESAAWYDVAELRFSQHSSELLTQPDGTYHEPTPGYFGAVRGHLFSFMALSELNGYQMDGALRSSIERMFVWFMEMTMQDGYMPMAGDTSPSDQRKGLALGAALFRRGDLKYVSGCKRLPTEFVWLVSKELFDGFAALESKKPEHTQTCLANCQYIILRDDWGRLGRGNSIFFDVNPVALGHNHFDYLNIEAVFDGERLITESGHLGYRHMFRLKYVVGLIGHNILMIDDGAGQAVWLSKIPPKISAKYFSDAYDFVEGSAVYPAKDGEEPLQWRRAVLYLKPDLFLICDLVKGRGTHTIKRFFHAGAQTAVDILPEGHGVRIAGRQSAAFVVSVSETGLSVTNDDGLENFDGKLEATVFRHTAALPMRTMAAIANGRSWSVPVIRKLCEDRFAVTYGNEQWTIQLEDMGDYTRFEIANEP